MKIKKSLLLLSIIGLLIVLPGFLDSTNIASSSLFNSLNNIRNFTNLKGFKSGLGQNQFGTTWVSIDPVQCEQTPWEQAGYNIQGNEKDSVNDYLQSENVHVFLVQIKQKYQFVCMSCGVCPRGDEVSVLVDTRDVDKMHQLGFH